MNEKLNIQNITEELAESYGISKRDAEAFIKEFFSVIEEGLEKDKYVKIKGFGTFKLIEVDSRESINVNTGERFEIQGHSKVTFTPDNNIKEAVNKPFSAFQTVVLADGVNIDAPEENLIDAMSDEIADEAVAEETPASEDVSPTITEDIVVEEEPSSTEEELAPVAEDTVEEKPTPVVEDTVTAGEEPSTDYEDPAAEEAPVAEEKPAEEPANVKILPIFDDEAIKKRDQPVSHQQEVMALKLTEEKRKEISKQAEGSATPYLMFLAVLVIMACLGVVAYIYYPDIAGINGEPPISSSAKYDNKVMQPANPVTKPVEETTAAPDSLTATAPATQSQTAQETSAAPAKQEVVAPVVVKEVSVPPAAAQTASSKPAAQTPAAAPTASTPASAASNARTIKVGNTTYAYDGEIETHVLERGETLFALSRKYYGSNAMYVVIIDYNKDVIKNPDNVPSGTRLRIPKVVKK